MCVRTCNPVTSAAGTGDAVGVYFISIACTFCAIFFFAIKKSLQGNELKKIKKMPE